MRACVCEQNAVLKCYTAGGTWKYHKVFKAEFCIYMDSEVLPCSFYPIQKTASHECTTNSVHIVFNLLFLNHPSTQRYVLPSTETR
jgi:hypothetical protein